MCQDTCPMESGICWVRQALEALGDKQCCLVTVLTLQSCSAATHLYVPKINYI